MKRECSMCTEYMRLREREHVSTIPGTSQTVRRTAVELECDYFEEASETDEGQRLENS